MGRDCGISISGLFILVVSMLQSDEEDASIEDEFDIFAQE